MNIDQSAMCYIISMDSSRQALQTNEKLLSNFGIIFQISLKKIIVALGSWMRGGEGICANQYAF